MLFFLLEYLLDQTAGCRIIVAEPSNDLRVGFDSDALRDQIFADHLNQRVSFHVLRMASRGQRFRVEALAALRLHGAGYNISLVFFAVQVGLLGWLVLRSAFLPRILGILLIVEALCNLAHCFGTFLKLGLIERFDSSVLLPALAAEGGMTLWLLLVGVNAASWRERTREGLAP